MALPGESRKPRLFPVSSQRSVRPGHPSVRPVQLGFARLQATARHLTSGDAGREKQPGMVWCTPYLAVGFGELGHKGAYTRVAEPQRRLRVAQYPNPEIPNRPLSGGWGRLSFMVRAPGEAMAWMQESRRGPVQCRVFGPAARPWC